MLLFFPDDDKKETDSYHNTLSLDYPHGKSEIYYSQGLVRVNLVGAIT